jgi:hypothetical protein
MLAHRAPLVLLLAGFLGAAGLPAPVLAGPNPDAKLLLHLVPAKKNAKLTCLTAGVNAAEDVVTQGELNPRHYMAYVLLVDFSLEEGMAGVQFGISYHDSLEHGVDILSWQHCALYEFPMDSWPGANSGNLLTWNQAENCQKESPLVIGYFYLTAYSADRLKLIPRPVDGLARTAACGIEALNAAEKIDNMKAEHLGWVDFGESPGYNPWDPKQNLLLLQERFKPRRN